MRKYYTRVYHPNTAAMYHPEIEKLAVLARREWGHASPYRIGIIAGELGLELSANALATKSSRWGRLYRDGHAYGTSTRNRLIHASPHPAPPRNQD